MSRQSQLISKSASSKVAPAPQPYCPHCANIGKPESVYRSHFVRASADPTSVVVCPELLSTECNHCFKSGHTRTHCPVLSAQEARRKKEEKVQKYAENVEKKAVEDKKQIQNQPRKPVGKFSALMDSSDSEAENETKVAPLIHKNKPKPAALAVATEFPALPSKTKVATTKTEISISYAGMAAKTKSEYEDELFLKEKMKKNAVGMPTLARNQAVSDGAQPVPKNNFWDGWDSENEDEAEFAAEKIKMEEHKRKIMSSKASEIINWAQDDSDSDEDW